MSRIPEIVPDLTNKDWWAYAACADVDPAIFMNSRSGVQSYREARRVCGSCPVRKQCFNDALTRKQIPGHGDHLFVAGCTPQEMTDYRRKAGYL